MFKVLVIGAGRIGTLISTLLFAHEDYEVYLADLNFSQSNKTRLANLSDAHKLTLNVDDTEALHALFKAHKFSAVISCLPFFKNVQVAEAAHANKTRYLDLTEDRATTEAIKKLADKKQTAFVPQCGLAPGFIGAMAYHLVSDFDDVADVHLRVGALPENSNHAFKYALTWSVEGLVNEYVQPCDALIEGKRTQVPPLSNLESITIDGVNYEAFNTSGGLGSLADLLQGHVANMNYKSVRYPGHQTILKLLLEEFKLKDDLKTLIHILEGAVPKTDEDVVVTYVRITGYKNGDLIEKHDVRKVYPENIAGHTWSAIQVCTASSVCAVLHTLLTKHANETGFVYQEKLPVHDLLQGPFGHYLANAEI